MENWITSTSKKLSLLFHMPVKGLLPRAVTTAGTEQALQEGGCWQGVCVPGKCTVCSPLNHKCTSAAMAGMQGAPPCLTLCYRDWACSPALQVHGKTVNSPATYQPCTAAPLNKYCFQQWRDIKNSKHTNAYLNFSRQTLLEAQTWKTVAEQIVGPGITLFCILKGSYQ